MLAWVWMIPLSWCLPIASFLNSRLPTGKYLMGQWSESWKVPCLGQSMAWISHWKECTLSQVSPWHKDRVKPSWIKRELGTCQAGGSWKGPDHKGIQRATWSDSGLKRCPRCGRQSRMQKSHFSERECFPMSLRRTNKSQALHCLFFCCGC